jgi:multiple sugar transport system permease protein
MQTKRKRKSVLRGNLFAYGIVGPSLLLIVLIILLPLLYSVSISFQGYKYGAPTGKIVWFRNFVDIFTKETVAPGFYESLLVTLKFTTVAVISVVVISLGIALLIREKGITSTLLKYALLLPYAIPGAVSAVVWNWIYDANFGVLNGALYGLGIIDEYVGITSNPDLALWAILFAYVWKFVPTSAFIFAAGLATISENVYEAAQIDGAGVFRTFFSITIPSLMPVMQLVLVMQTIFALVMHFGLVFVLTQGGPGSSTRTLAWLIYMESFTYTRFGRGTAMAIILAFIMIGFIYIYLGVLNPERRAEKGV